MLSCATSQEAGEIVSEATPVHRTVLLREVVAFLRPLPGSSFIDTTLGPGGHAEALLEATSPDGRLLGIDRDPATLHLARARLSRFGTRFVGVQGDYRDLASLAHGAGFFVVEGVVADLGISSFQLDDAERGFSFRADGPLDMRMDPAAGTATAADLLASLTEVELRHIFRAFGEERLSGPIARAIVRRRATRPITRTTDLASLIERTAGPAARRFRIHPATRTFQALRIAVNGELEHLAALVDQAVALSRRGGRVAVISFHSLEDRAVKQAMRALAERCVCPPGLPVCGCGRENLVRGVAGSPAVPSPEEVAINPRARSARLRVVERL